LLKSSKTDANVLILGENGTGKFVFAEHIHQHSDRKDKPFVHIDLGSLSENLFESELWLCQRCFTDAKTDTRFETADNGTVLDEIGNIPYICNQNYCMFYKQEKSLRRKQTQKFKRKNHLGNQQRY
jgi:DNA-binding NtrC family response regulator